MAEPLEVIVLVGGGVVQDVDVPHGVRVEVRDYDNAEGLQEDDIKEDGTTDAEGHTDWTYGVDDDGNVYQLAVYGQLDPASRDDHPGAP